MSINKTVEKILEYKDFLASRYSTASSGNKIQEFKDLILSSDSIEYLKNFEINSKESSYINNYLNAALMSLLMEQEGYDLDNWNDFVNEIHPELKNQNQHFNAINEAKTLENLVLHTVNQVFQLNGQNIYAFLPNSSSNPNSLLDDFGNCFLPEDANKRILDKVKITMKVRSSDEKKVWGDNDVLIVAFPNTIDEAEAICLVSCKTSLRERVYQSIFWALHSRIEGIGNHVFVTLDKGDSKYKKSEIKNSSENNRKTRDVLESTMERVYVFRNALEVNRSYVIKDFDYLKNDLLRWKENHFGL